MNPALAGVLMVVVSAICFSAKAIFAKLAYGYGADPSTVLTLRMVSALPFFWVAGLRAERAPGVAPLARAEIIRLILLGSVGYYLASLFDFAGLRYISASLERLILFLYPTMVLLMTAGLYGEKLGRRTVAALALSYGGVGLVFVNDRVSGGSDVVFGSALVFAGALAYAFYLAFSQPLIERHGSTRVTSHVLVVACLCVIAQFILEADYGRLVQPVEVYALAVATGVVATVIPAFLLTAGIARIGAGRASLIGTVGPVSTIVLAHIFLDEPLTLMQVVGSTLVLSGVVVISRGRSGKRSPQPPTRSPLEVAELPPGPRAAP